jgi:hypothetical protein
LRHNELRREFRSVESLAFWFGKGGSFGAATDAVVLPQPKPRTIGLSLIVPSIGGHKVAGGQRPLVGNGEDPFQPLDFGNGLLRIHTPNMYQNRAEVK